MANTSTYEKYFVPAQSRMPVLMAFSMFLSVYGAGRWLNGGTATIFMLGALCLAFTMFNWFSKVIGENLAGLNSDQLKRSYVWGMGWFIFSEVMFFAAFFGALFYIRALNGPWLGGEFGDSLSYFGNDFTFNWPMLENPDNSAFTPPEGVIHAMGLPLWNTIILISSSVTVTIAHHALIAQKRQQLNIWLGLTVLLGALFLYFQATEYHEAYTELGLTLHSGIYGTTFFMLTGFHGAHVTIGTFMLLMMFFRSLKGHFKPNDHFGFQAAAWYWHFVDVVWICLFVFVYWV
ncbi:cytochrome c oxidase subunit 3 [Gynuella sunshinyii]|uniref:cytochrome-c oxidase n=1 Tax=Gynuella sunshinyii YC6258 TaxID=1445510 RepID=A0A0C5VE50_9GAMM|nr:cytochrome c oxidase subunit 3 [Gynuella sunshinyii]AJQ92777.1 heme/copper-type cytochrome/quinol oxidase, subunit 3 [Gynuella sunshinyii YC6258]